MSHETTRRALLAGAIATPAIFAVPAAAFASPPTLDRTVWDRRLALYRRRVARLTHFHNGAGYRDALSRFTVRRDALPDIISAVHHPEAWAERAALVSELRPWEDRYAVLAGQSFDALKLLMVTPAPTLAEVGVKLELWIEETGDALMERPQTVAILEDVKRLTLSD